MINIKDYAHYWDDIAKRVGGITRCIFATQDDNFGKIVQTLGRGDTPVLFFLPPTAAATTKSAYDAYIEDNACVIFLMRRIDPQRDATIDVLASLQPTIEKIKEVLLSDAGVCCAPMHVNAESISTEAETSFYNNFIGWSIGFTAR